MGNQSFTIIYFGVLIVLFYVLIIRPQIKRQREAAALQSSLKLGDEVLTGGGVYGVVRGLEEDRIRVEVADGVVITVARGAVVRRLEE